MIVLLPYRFPARAQLAAHDGTYDDVKKIASGIGLEALGVAR